MVPNDLAVVLLSAHVTAKETYSNHKQGQLGESNRFVQCTVILYRVTA
jgi:hypothetical protein